MLHRARQRLQQLKPAFSQWRERRGGRAGIHHHHPHPLPDDCLRLLSFNIQAGIGTSAYRHYVTRSWRHILPAVDATAPLDRIGDLLSDFDLVMLQEVDGGSLRSRFVNQLDYLAEYAEFEFSHQQLNRNLGKLGQYSNGMLSRVTPRQVEDHNLPGLPGRGAIVARFGLGDDPLLVINLHLALSEKARNAQLAYVGELVNAHKYVVVMGDMNCRAEQLVHTPLADTQLLQAAAELHTFPSWQPRRAIDHILVSPSLKVRSIEVLDCTLSDHRPVAMELELPGELRQA